MKNLELINNVSEKDYQILKEWMISENKTGNISTISKCFKNDELLILKIFDKIVGYSAYVTFDKTASIEVFEINRKYRKNGYGRKLAKETFLKIKEKKKEVITLFCSPANSELFWKKMNFINYPKTPNNEDQIKLFLPLIDYLKPSNKKEGSETIEIWKSFDYKKKNADWIWNIKFNKNSRTLLKPIILPFERNFAIRWIANKTVIELSEIKRINFSEKEGDIMVIRKLPIKNTKHNNV